MKVVKVLDTIEVISALTGKPQQRRVVILQRDDGYFTVAQEYFYTSEYEGKIIAQRWARLGSSQSIFASAEMAEADGRLLLQRLRTRKESPTQ
jgi:hypothetical protein